MSFNNAHFKISRVPSDTDSEDLLDFSKVIKQMVTRYVNHF